MTIEEKALEIFPVIMAKGIEGFYDANEGYRITYVEGYRYGYEIGCEKGEYLMGCDNSDI